MQLEKTVRSKAARQMVAMTLAAAMAVPVAPRPAAAQSEAESAEALVDTYLSVVTMAYPPAGAALGAAKGMFEMFGFFAKPDLVGEALKVVAQRLDILEARLAAVQAQVEQLENDLYRQKNLERLRELWDRRRDLTNLVLELRERPTDRAVRRALGTRAQTLADSYLFREDPASGVLEGDADLWKWNDLHIPSGQMLDAEFKPLPAFEFYLTALVAWMAAIPIAADGDAAFVKSTYGPSLARHVAFLSERLDWKPGKAPVTLPENVRNKISCQFQPATRTPVGPSVVCDIALYCHDGIARRLQYVRSAQMTVDSPDSMCNVPATWGGGIEEEALEDAYGTDLMARLADKLSRVLHTGTLGDEYIGRFDNTLWDLSTIYAVKPNGDLLWYQHKIGIDHHPQPAPQGGTGSTTAVTGLSRLTDGVSVVSGPALVQNGTSTTIAITSPVPSAFPLPPTVVHQWNGPRQVGSGWGSFLDLVPAGQASFYAVTPDTGSLMWYRHDGFLDGAFSWAAPDRMGSGWQSFARIVPAADGVLYGIQPDGRLIWYRHREYREGTRHTWMDPLPIGGGWSSFAHVFSTGEGVIYGVTPEGVLRWYKHDGYLTGAKTWQAPQDIGTGWQSFKKIFSSHSGHIYALKPTGELLWYQHTGYRDGARTWRGPVQIAADWSDFTQVFALMPGTYLPPVR